MKSNSLYILFIITFLSFSCNQGNDKTSKVGDVDFQAIAADTTMQNNIETSFEYVKDHPFGNRAFSIVNGGYTGFKDALITERISMKEFDTVIVLHLDSQRIQTSFITDFNYDESPEIHVITKPIGKKYLINNIASFNRGKWTVQSISLQNEMAAVSGTPTWTQIENSLLLEFPTTTSLTQIRFLLKNNRFIIQKTDSIISQNKTQ